MKAVIDHSWNKLGSCLFCMRQALRAAAFAWLLTAVSLVFNSIWFTAVSAAAAFLLAMLWGAHLLAFGTKAANANSAITVIDDVTVVANSEVSSRRKFVNTFARAVSFAAAATIFPSLARADCCFPGMTCCSSDQGDWCCPGTDVPGKPSHCVYPHGCR